MSRTSLDREQELHEHALAASHANGWHPEHDVEDCPRCTVERSGEGRCYSDHNEDVRVKGSCDYCGESEVET